jgi:TonB-linked SusC/RagA family outer membrane protein
MKNVTIKDVLSQIEDQSDFYFLYDNKLIDVHKKVDIVVQNEQIVVILKKLFGEGEVNAVIRDRHIILTPEEVSVSQQILKVSGRVTDSSGVPLPGVTVVIKGTTQGTITNDSGDYLFPNVPSDATLAFSFVGMRTQEISIAGKSIINVVMEEDAIGIEEVVAVGYGSLRKKDITGAISSVNSDQLSENATTNLAQAMQGKVSGVMISQNGWRPGSETTIRIRGNRSFSATNDPLYVIDGIPIERGLNEINQNDIETMEILKDASATAIYGSRGANGVVLITTKRGKQGKSVISYDGYYGFQKPVKLLDIMNGPEFAEFVREAYRNRQNVTARYNSPVPSMEEDRKNVIFGQDSYVLESVLMGYDENGNYDPSKVRSFDWVDAVLRTGMIQDHQLSLTGGNEQTKLMFSAGYFENKGLQEGNDYLRYNFRVNIDHQVNKSVNVGTSTLFSHAYEQVGANLYDNARNMNPLARAWDDEGNIIRNPGNDGLAVNPIANIEGNLNDYKRNRIITNGFLEVKLFKGISYRFNAGLDYRTARDGRFYSQLARNGALPEAQYGGNWLKNYTINNILYYDGQFGNDHSLKATLLHEIQSFRQESDNSIARGIPANYQQWYALGAASELVNIQSGLSKWQMLSYMGRINYNYKNRYLLTATGRVDGSSVLAEGHKYQFFPSLSLAWRISDENFMGGISRIDDLKVRLGYGKTGNSSVSPYQTQGGLSLLRYSWDENVLISFAPGSIPNPNLSWETTDQFNIGIDYALYKGRLSGALELYRQNTHDLLMSKQLPVASGFDQILQNIGKTRNSGLEFSLSSINIDGKNGAFAWKTDLIFSTNKEEIIELYGGTKDDIGNRWFVGKPLNVFYDYEFGGIWQDTAEDLAEMAKFNANGSTYTPGLVKIVDQNGDYRINADDRKILGQARPEWFGGITNYFSYKNIDLSFQWYASVGNMVYSDLVLRMEGRWNSVKVDYWTPDNPSNSYPKPSADWETPPNINLTYYQDASFVRLKFVTLGYTFPKRLLPKLQISNMRVYASAQNPLLFTKFNGLDPEGASGYTNPSTMTFLMGLNVSF